MSDSIVITCIICSTAIFIVLCLGLFVGDHSNFEKLVLAWENVKKAEVEVKKLEAQHAQVCPRLTDIPRKV